MLTIGISKARHLERELEALARRLRERTAREGQKLNRRTLNQSLRAKSSRARSSRQQGKFVKRNVVQTINYKKLKGSIHGDQYAEKRATKSFTNMLGKNSRERAAEFALDMARHPGVAGDRLIIHVALSLPTSQRRTASEWHEAVNLLIKKIGASGCHYAAHLHDDTENQHVHLIYSRARPDGTLISQSWDYLKHREAAAQVAQELFGGRETPRPSNTNMAPPSDRAEAAARRARRRGTLPNHIDPATLRAALERANSPAELAQVLQERQIEMSISRRADGTARGLLLRHHGAQEWLAGSSISREFSLPRVQARLAENAAVVPTAIQRHRALPHTEVYRPATTNTPTSSHRYGG